MDTAYDLALFYSGRLHSQATVEQEVMGIWNFVQ